MAGSPPGPALDRRLYQPDLSRFKGSQLGGEGGPLQTEHVGCLFLIP